ncbi:MAG: helix-turn-helix transcriptional regulator [Nevskiales bacterium]
MTDSTTKTQVYFWPRCFVLRTCEFVQQVDIKPYQRLAATLIVSVDKPFRLRINESPAAEYRVALLSPHARRHELHLTHKNSYLFDIGLSSPEYDRIHSLLRYGEAAVPENAGQLLDYLAIWSDKSLNCNNAPELLNDCIDIIAPQAARPLIRDARIKRVLELIDELPRDELSVSGLAQEVGLSESRLRSLSQRYLGCSLSRYMRWIAAWRSVEIWRPNMSFTEVAHAAGFHDLSHANRTFHELFGMPPSRMLKSPDIVVHRCNT